MALTVDVRRFLTIERQAQTYFATKRDVKMEVKMQSVAGAAGLGGTDIAYGRR
jgi:hypothetical protein